MSSGNDPRSIQEVLSLPLECFDCGSKDIGFAMKDCKDGKVVDDRFVVTIALEPSCGSCGGLHIGYRWVEINVTIDADKE